MGVYLGQKLIGISSASAGGGAGSGGGRLSPGTSLEFLGPDATEAQYNVLSGSSVQDIYKQQAFPTFYGHSYTTGAVNAFVSTYPPNFSTENLQSNLVSSLTTVMYRGTYDFGDDSWLYSMEKANSFTGDSTDNADNWDNDWSYRYSTNTEQDQTHMYPGTFAIGANRPASINRVKYGSFDSNDTWITYYDSTGRGTDTDDEQTGGVLWGLGHLGYNYDTSNALTSYGCEVSIRATITDSQNNERVLEFKMPEYQSRQTNYNFSWYGNGMWFGDGLRPTRSTDNTQSYPTYIADLYPTDYPMGYYNRWDNGVVKWPKSDDVSKFYLSNDDGGIYGETNYLRNQIYYATRSANNGTAARFSFEDAVHADLNYSDLDSTHKVFVGNGVAADGTILNSTEHEIRPWWNKGGANLIFGQVDYLTEVGTPCIHFEKSLKLEFKVNLRQGAVKDGTSTASDTGQVLFNMRPMAIVKKF